MSDLSYSNMHMPQSQYYEQDWDNHHHSSPSQWGYNSLLSYCQPPFQQSSSYALFSDQSINEESDIERSRKAILEYLESQNSIDSSIPQNSQIQDPYSIFSSPITTRRMKYMIQSKNSYNHSIDRLEEIISQLKNMYKNEKTFPTQSLTILDFPSHIERNQELWCPGNWFTFITPSGTWPILNHWQIGKFSWNWAWTWMWTRFSILWFCYVFWINVNSGILTQFGPNFQAKTDFLTYKPRTWTTCFG